MESRQSCSSIDNAALYYPSTLALPSWGLPAYQSFTGTRSQLLVILTVDYYQTHHLNPTMPLIRKRRSVSPSIHSHNSPSLKLTHSSKPKPPPLPLKRVDGAPAPPPKPPSPTPKTAPNSMATRKTKTMLAVRRTRWSRSSCAWPWRANIRGNL